MNDIFHAFTVKYTGITNRITTEVLLFPAFDPKQYPNGPPFKPFKTIALWDTGATNSVITANTAKALNLVSIGLTKMKHADAEVDCNSYLVNIFLPNRVGIPGIRVIECQNDNSGFGAIIGMDIITSGDISITNVNGKTIMTFRIPSIKTIDYVDEAETIKRNAKLKTISNIAKLVSPNKPCPCGKKSKSGRRLKYRECCGKTG